MAGVAEQLEADAERPARSPAQSSHEAAGLRFHIKPSKQIPCNFNNKPKLYQSYMTHFMARKASVILPNFRYPVLYPRNDRIFPCTSAYRSLSRKHQGYPEQHLGVKEVLKRFERLRSL